MAADSSSLRAVEETIVSEELKRNLKHGKAILNSSVQGRALHFNTLLKEVGLENKVLCAAWLSTCHKGEGCLGLGQNSFPR